MAVLCCPHSCCRSPVHPGKFKQAKFSPFFASISADPSFRQYHCSNKFLRNHEKHPSISRPRRGSRDSFSLGLQPSRGPPHHSHPETRLHRLLHVRQLRTGTFKLRNLVANYLPLQDAYGGLNYFQLDEHTVYEIHIDDTGDSCEDLTLQFRFHNTLRPFTLTVGPEGNRRTNAAPVLAVGQITDTNNGALLVDQTYTLTVIRGNRRTGTSTPILNPKDGTPTFIKPQDNVGNKTFPNYDAYANQYIYEVALPGTAKKGKVFVDQRKDPFVVNLGETFDLINISTSPLGPENANTDNLADKNVTPLVVELPKEFLVSGPGQPIIGGWSTASTVKGDVYTQVSRLGMPLVNEVVIGVKDKDKFNASEPKDDLAKFVDYITHPTLPVIIVLLYKSAGAIAPTAFPRADLVAVFATSIATLNQPPGVAAGEMQRLNTAVAATPRNLQNNLGVIAGVTKGVLDASKADLAGFPNGRRPGDDIADIALRVVMGKLLTPDVAPPGDAPFTDGATVNTTMFDDAFPYLRPPIAGSPNDSITISTETGKSVNGSFNRVKPSYDSATRTLTVPKPDAASEIIKVKSDRPIGLGGVTVTENSVSAKVQ